MDMSTPDSDNLVTYTRPIVRVKRKRNPFGYLGQSLNLYSIVNNNEALTNMNGYIRHNHIQYNSLYTIKFLFVALC